MRGANEEALTVTAALRDWILNLPPGARVNWPLVNAVLGPRLKARTSNLDKIFYKLARQLLAKGVLDRPANAHGAEYKRTALRREELEPRSLRTDLRKALSVADALAGGGWGPPDIIIEAGIPAYAFGAVFSIFGGAGFVVPTSLFLTIGAWRSGDGRVRWLRREQDRVRWRPRYGEYGLDKVRLVTEGKAAIGSRFPEILGDRSPFRAGEFEALLDALTKFDYAFSWASGTGHGLSAAGAVAAAFATLAMATCKFESQPTIPKLSKGDSPYLWAIPPPQKDTFLRDIWGKNGDFDAPRSLFRRYLRLCQLLERIWNTNNETETRRIDKIWNALDARREMPILDYSSGGSSLCASLGLPVLVRLDKKQGSKTWGEVSSEHTIVYPKLKPDAPVHILIDKRGKPEATHTVLKETVDRYADLIKFDLDKSARIIRSLIESSDVVAQISASTLADPSLRAKQFGSVFSSCMRVQRGLYMQIETPPEEFYAIYPKTLGHEGLEISPVGLGGGGTYLVYSTSREAVDGLIRRLPRPHLGLRMPASNLSFNGRVLAPLEGVPLAAYELDLRQ